MTKATLKLTTKVALFITIIITFTYCTDATRAKLGGYGSKFLVEMINCDGTTGRSWISTGKVHSEENSDGYYFMDQNTNKVVEVTGNLVITRLNK